MMNQTIPKAHLQPIPAFDEPFSKIIIDCVGVLPKTKSGCQYLLPIMCASTCFPKANPLRNNQSKTIVKALEVFHICTPSYIDLYNRIKGHILCQEYFNKSCLNLALSNTSHQLTILKAKVP